MSYGPTTSLTSSSPFSFLPLWPPGPSLSSGNVARTPLLQGMLPLSIVWILSAGYFPVSSLVLSSAVPSP